MKIFTSKELCPHEHSQLPTLVSCAFADLHRCFLPNILQLLEHLLNVTVLAFRSFLLVEVGSA